MASSLINSVTQILSSNVLERFSSSVGLQKTQVDNAVQGGVPAVLAALSSLVSRPGGAAALKEAVDQQPSGALTKIASAIGGSGQNTMIDSGTAALRSLLGSAPTSAISNAIGQYAGIGGNQCDSIVGLLGSTVMAALGQQQRASNLDAAGLARLLGSQKDNIVRSLPAGISKYLSSAGILDSLSPSDDERPVSASRTYSGSSRKTVAPTPKPASMPWGWLLPALALLAFGGLAWMFSRPDTTQTVTAPAPSQSVAVNAPQPTKTETPLKTTGSDAMVQEAPSSTGTSTGVSGLGPMPAPFQALENLRGIKVGDVDIGAQLASAVTDMRSSLTSIQDTTSAQATVAPLTSSASEFARLTKLLDQLSPEARKTVVNTIVATRPTLDQLFDKALAIPGVSALIKPTVDSIRSQFDTLTTA